MNLLALLGCAHARATFPLTPTRKGFASGQTYVACLDCGKRFAYNWHAMKRGAEIREGAPVALGGVVEVER